MTGILGKLAGIGNKIKALPGIASNMIKRVGNFIRENPETIEKIAGGVIGGGLTAYTGGTAYPFIYGANQLIQSLPDNDFTKHLKTISKAAALDFGPTKPEVDTGNNQTNALVEYPAALPSHFVQSSSGSTHSPMYFRAPRGVYYRTPHRMYYRAPRKKLEPPKSRAPAAPKMLELTYNKNSSKSKPKGKKAKGQKAKGKR